MKLIYLASPYTHQESYIMDMRAIMVCDVMAKCFNKYKHTFFSPVCHGHSMMKESSTKAPSSWEYWKNHDLNMIHRCDELWVVTLANWEESVGMEEEVLYADRKKMPIRYIDVMGDII